MGAAIFDNRSRDATSIITQVAINASQVAPGGIVSKMAALTELQVPYNPMSHLILQNPVAKIHSCVAVTIATRFVSVISINCRSRILDVPFLSKPR